MRSYESYMLQVQASSRPPVLAAPLSTTHERQTSGIPIPVQVMKATPPPSPPSSVLVGKVVEPMNLDPHVLSLREKQLGSLQTSLPSSLPARTPGKSISSFSMKEGSTSLRKESSDVEDVDPFRKY